MSLIRFLIAVVLLLPMVASANDASEFTGASSAEQVRLLEAWAAEPVPARLGLLVALQEGRVASDADKKPFGDRTGAQAAFEQPPAWPGGNCPGQPSPAQ
jgi:urea transport system permease protein